MSLSVMVKPNSRRYRALARAVKADHVGAISDYRGFALHRHDDDQWRERRNGLRVRSTASESLWHKKGTKSGQLGRAACI